MKKIEKIAIIFIVLLFLGRIANIISQTYMKEIMHKYEWSRWEVFYLTIPVFAFVIGLQVAISIWLFILAKNEKNNPWTWALLGFAFSLPAVILYYVIKIHDNMKTKSSEPKDVSNPASPDR